MGRHRGATIGGVGALALLLSAGWELSPAPGAFFSPGLHLLLETTAGLVALLVAYLLFGRHRHTGRVLELACAMSLGMLAASHLAFGALPAAIAGEPPVWSAWAAMAASVAATVPFFAAAVAPERRAPRAGTAVVVSLATVLVIGLVAVLAEPRGLGESPRIAVHVIGAVCFAVATLLFARHRDELFGWLAAAALLAAVARVNFAIHPTLYTSAVGPGDLLRLLVHVALLAGAVRELERHWRGLAAAAAGEERRRIARDLHDGIAQELAYIARRTDPGTEAHASARRALEDARAAIAALRSPHQTPLAVRLETVARRVARRAGSGVTVTVAEGLELAPADEDEIVRIAGEAVANAVRHGGARHVWVDLAGGRLRIRDDGSGLPVGRRGGHGLAGIGERAGVLGGELRLRSLPGEGTEVEVVLP